MLKEFSTHIKQILHKPSISADEQLRNLEEYQRVMNAVSVTKDFLTYPHNTEANVLWDGADAFFHTNDSYQRLTDHNAQRYFTSSDIKSPGSSTLFQAIYVPVMSSDQMQIGADLVKVTVVKNQDTSLEPISVDVGLLKCVLTPSDYWTNTGNQQLYNHQLGVASGFSNVEVQFPAGSTSSEGCGFRLSYRDNNENAYKNTYFYRWPELDHLGREAYLGRVIQFFDPFAWQKNLS